MVTNFSGIERDVVSCLYESDVILFSISICNLLLGLSFLILELNTIFILLNFQDYIGHSFPIHKFTLISRIISVNWIALYNVVVMSSSFSISNDNIIGWII